MEMDAFVEFDIHSGRHFNVFSQRHWSPEPSILWGPHRNTWIFHRPDLERDITFQYGTQSYHLEVNWEKRPVDCSTTDREAKRHCPYGAGGGDGEDIKKFYAMQEEYMWDVTFHYLHHKSGDTSAHVSFADVCQSLFHYTQKQEKNPNTHIQYARALENVFAMCENMDITPPHPPPPPDLIWPEKLK